MGVGKIMQQEAQSLTYEDATIRFEKFFRAYYSEDIMRVVRCYPETRSLQVNFEKLDAHDSPLADWLLNNPDGAIHAAQRALKTVEPPMDLSPARINVRFESLPPSNKLMIRDIRNEHIGKLLAVDGIVRKSTDVRPKLLKGIFECPRCGQKDGIDQDGDSVKEPSACTSCEKKGPFKLLVEESTFVDAQKIMIQESLDDLRGGEHPKQLTIYLEDDQTGRITPGDTIEVVGVLRAAQKRLKDQRSRVFEISIDANSFKPTEIDFEDVKITKEDEKQILELSKDSQIYEKIRDSIAPHIYGNKEVKEAIMYQLFSSPPINLPDGGRIRGDSHIILMGEPAVGKSEILQYVAKELAPRGVYASGKGTSGAGLTAAAIKDEFGDGGWTLEAGALVLADGGVACIDEFDKMEPNDRGAMHEAMEQQSYHPSTEIMFSNGEKAEIGKFVDELMSLNGEKVVQGKDCEILSLSGIRKFEVLTTDFKNIYPLAVNRVSRHRASAHFLKITYSTGRSIIVTPEHPIYILEGEEIKEVRADSVKTGMLAPAPVKYPIKNNEVELSKVDISTTNKTVSFPSEIDENLARLLGYIASEGHAYRSARNRTAEIMVSNTDEEIIQDVCKIVRDVFGIVPYLQRQAKERRKNATRDLLTARCISLPLYEFFESNFPEVIKKAHEKRIPGGIFHTPRENKVQFLLGAFRGDGFCDSERFGYVTNSLNLARDYSDLLLSLGIRSYITESSTYFSNKDKKFKTAYKVVISGSVDAEIFYELIGRRDKRKEKINRLVQRSKNRWNDHDRVPSEVAARIKNLLKEYRLDDGYFYRSVKTNGAVHRKVALKHLDRVESYVYSLGGAFCINDPREIRKKYRLRIDEVASKIKKSSSMVTHIERNPSTKNYASLLESVKQLAREKIENTRAAFKKLKELVASDINFVEIKSVEVLRNEGIEWVYDVTVEPNHTFISEGLVLHNTVSIAKAGILATFRARCSILAAANPKFGRFDEYKSISEQVNLPPTILSRFDLIFFVKDDLSETREVAKHILDTVVTPDVTVAPKIPIELMRKYISYARQKVFPVLGSEARKRVEEFYVQMREAAQSAENVSPIPLTARQLWAILRVARAASRVRLSSETTVEDVDRAIRLITVSLKQAGVDLETGKVDIDKIMLGTTKSQRDRLSRVLDIIKEVERTFDTAPKSEIVERAAKEGISQSEAEKAIEKLKQDGFVYDPNRNEKYKVV